MSFTHVVVPQNDNKIFDFEWVNLMGTKRLAGGILCDVTSSEYNSLRHMYNPAQVYFCPDEKTAEDLATNLAKRFPGSCWAIAELRMAIQQVMVSVKTTKTRYTKEGILPCE